MEFKNKTFRERASQKFDKNKIFFEKCGKKINVYDFIQEGREDTEIYPTLEKYGCIDKMMINKEDVFADYTELQKMQDLRGIKDFEIKAKQMFYNLPLDVRKEFDNDINKFTKGADEFVAKLRQQENEKQAQQPIEEGVKENG